MRALNITHFRKSNPPSSNLVRSARSALSVSLSSNEHYSFFSSLPIFALVAWFQHRRFSFHPFSSLKSSRALHFCFRSSFTVYSLFHLLNQHINGMFYFIPHFQSLTRLISFDYILLPLTCVSPFLILFGIFAGVASRSQRRVP